MTRLVGSIERFYDDGAAQYSLLSEDRDFERQARCLAEEIAGVPRGGRYLELFAGPARHAIELEQRYDYTSVALDASLGMRDVATRPGGLAAERYITSVLPTLPPVAALGPAFDLVSILRYSTGYLAPTELAELLAKLAPVVAPAARLVLELHDLDLVRDDFRSLDIRDRVVEIGDGRSLRCIWPAGPLRWTKGDWTVEMDVTIQILVGDRVARESRFVSIERIYARSEIAGLASATGRWRLASHDADAIAESFPGSTMVVLERI
ncbi:MAG: class I SAM-dependent methyltransferase [Hyphomicrobiaceae bacterium]|nr:class I SAM-dependent methyltransferase [Hyphomicrobiaceae bacterium]